VRRNALAIYTPTAGPVYEGRLAKPVAGAERQTYLLATGLAARGLRVAHVVFAVDELRRPEAERLTVVQRPQLHGPITWRTRIQDTRILWRSFDEADAAVYLVRIGSAALGAAAVYCRLKRRKLIFAAANNTDFTLAAFPSGHGRVLSYKLGLRFADAVVVQTAEQQRLARELLGASRRITEIPSFGQAAPEATGEAEAFLWIGRLVDDKRPLDYVELARAVPDARFRMIAMETNQTPPELKAQLHEHAARLDNLEVLPGQPHRTTLDLLDRAVAAVSTSGGAEGMPNVFLEAWARGIPVLTLDFDPDGRIRDRGLGVSAGGSREAFVAGARSLWEQRSDRSEVSARARAYMQETHGLEAVTARWHALVRELGG
jgi:glycosyltransferase involved in cell wall biosynthesis